MAKKIGLIPFKMEAIVKENEMMNDTDENETVSEPEKVFKVCLTNQDNNLIPFSVYSEPGYNLIECIIKRSKMMIGLVPVHGAMIKKIYEDLNQSIFAIETEKCDASCVWVEDYSALPEEYIQGINKIKK